MRAYDTLCSVNDYVNVLNVNTGKVGRIRRKLFDNPTFNSGVLVEVQPGTKPYNSALYKPVDAETFIEQHPDKVVAQEVPNNETPNEEPGEEE